MRTIDIKAGERAEVLRIFSDSVPQTVRFTAETTDGCPVGGAVEIVRRPWFITKPVEHHPLLARQSFPKGFTDVDYAIYVTPDTDTRVTFQSRHLQRRTLFRILGGLVIFGLLSALVVPLILGR